MHALWDYQDTLHLQQYCHHLPRLLEHRNHLQPKTDLALQLAAMPLLALVREWSEWKGTGHGSLRARISECCLLTLPSTLPTADAIRCRFPPISALCTLFVRTRALPTHSPFQ